MRRGKFVYKFDTKVQHLKYKVLRTVAKHAWEGDLAESILDIPKEIIPGKVPTMRCCVYKERAILAERIKLATGGNRKNPNVIEALDIACDDCPSGGYVITDNCRGCIAHRCEDACPKGAITHDEHHHAHIDKERCINCGRCAEACPYSAILNRRRPCQNACKIGAITMNEDGTVKIEDSKCISCGACVYRCPFGALSDKSFILDAIKLLKEEKHVYAIVAPAIASQFAYAKLGQVVTGIKQLGFYEVVEAALGADMVAYAEAKELAEKGFLTSSCCPALIQLVPAIALGNISLVAIYALIYKKVADKVWLRDVLAVVLAAAVKLAVLFLLIVKILIPLLALPDKQAAMMSAMFSWPQLVTALIGGVLGTAVSIPVKKAMSGKK